MSVLLRSLCVLINRDRRCAHAHGRVVSDGGVMNSYHFRLLCNLLRKVYSEPLHVCRWGGG